MGGGYMGKMLWVNLHTGEIKIEVPEERLYHDFIGGYGIGSRLLYSRQRGGVDPLGPENTLGIITGILTGSPVPMACRYEVVAKSPLTGGWGNANCGADFGPYLKFAGYDAIFFTGIAERPVYFLIDNGSAELRDASHLWGKNTFDTEDLLMEAHGDTAKVITIGLPGEMCSLLACIITHKGSAAGRSGLGAVMGSKNLKAVVVKGEMKVPLADPDTVNSLRKEYLPKFRSPITQGLHTWGTAIHAASSIHSGDTPIKNWGGVGVIDLPDASGLEKEMINSDIDKLTGCWHCPVACRGTYKEGTGEYKYPAGTKRFEYETAAAFGGMCLNTNADSIKMANHLCNMYGMDTISTGTTIAFAMECYDHGLITSSDTDGIELRWGDHQAMLNMLDKMARREGFGAVLADGVKVAAERIGKGAEEFAVHIGGQELGLHDPKFDFPAFHGTPTAAKYAMDAAPGRHTAGFGPTQFQGYLVNAAGLCLHMNTLPFDRDKYMTDFMKAVTGWDRPMSDLLKAGERIGNMRHVFSLREGDNPLKRKVHGRIIGEPPFKEGPLAGVSADLQAQIYWNLGALDWDRETTVPSKKKLLALGLDDVAEELWPPQTGKGPGGH
ncbi:MAG: aldehyde ferredoxin oxidoreductase family protein [Dehalococcoidales bacterium]|nr:aldehyde ferredoxin oxidoreductase family protein [Dehalococcoidales bacterium]